MEARRAGEDVIDLGFGNPDIPSPDVAVEKLAEAVAQPAQPPLLGEPRASRSSASRSPTSTGASSASTSTPRPQVCTTIGAKEGFSHLMWVLLGPGDTALVPSPSYPIHIWGPILAGAEVRYVRLGPEQDFFDNLLEAWEEAWPRPRVIVLSFPHNPTTACVDLEFMAAHGRVRARARRAARARLRVRGPRLRRLRPAVDPAGPGRRATSRSSSTRSRSRSRWPGWRMGFLLGNAEVVAALAQAQELPRLRHVPADPDRVDRRDERGARLPARGQRDLPRPPRRADRRPRPRRLGRSRGRRGRCSCGRRSRSPTRSSAASSSPSCSCRRPRSRSRPASASGPGGEGFVRFALVENEQRIGQAVRGIAQRPHQARLTPDASRSARLPDRRGLVARQYRP